MVASPNDEPREPSSSKASYPYPFDRPWTITSAVPFACILEASAPKAGNVHPARSFADMQYAHFVGSAMAIAPVFQQHVSQQVASVGQLVLDAVQATRATVGCNTNLGTLLLFAPLVSGYQKATNRSGIPPSRQAWRNTTQEALNDLDRSDSELVYQAIRHAKPGGIGKQTTRDIQDDAPESLVSAMAQVAQVDAVARQYCNGFSDIFDRLLPWFDQALEQSSTSDEAICRLQIRQLAFEPDGLIVRKVGEAVACKAQELARDVCKEEESDVPIILRASYLKLDHFLRADSNRRNPGTSADLIAATIFARLLLYKSQ